MCGLGDNLESVMKKKVVIAGGGFAGIQLAQNLNKKLFEVVLIDRLNHHQFQPLFYQVATSQIEPSSISFPLRYIFGKSSGVRIKMGEVFEIIQDRNLLITNIGEISYDILVLASGCKTNFYNNSETEKYSFSLKSTFDAIEIRNHIILVFERTVSASNIEKESLLNLVIVGGGPTGVELAGSFAEIKKYVLPKDYPDFDFSKFKVHLVEGGPNLLPSMSEKASSASQVYLKRLGIELHMQTLVESYNGKVVKLSNGKQLSSETVIWTAGVTGNMIKGLPENVWIANNRIKVNRHNLVEDTKNIYAIGDISYMTTPLYPRAHPQVANVAINQAKLLASNLKRMEKGRHTVEYEYKNLGSMATIGGNKAVVDLPFLKFYGRFAWFVWMFTHLMLILSVKNKLIIFINWAWNYLTKNSSLRLILKKN